MISSNRSLIVVAAMISVSAANAREVDFVRFSPFAISASNEPGAVGVSLSSHFEGLVEPVDALGIGERTHGGVMQTPGLLGRIQNEAAQLGADYFRGKAQDVVVAPGLGEQVGLFGALALAMDAATAKRR